MNILCVSAQKPDSTGSGVYLAETVRSFLAAGHQVAVITGIDRDDHPVLPEGALLCPVRFRTEQLPFPVCGMSDEMPYEATRYCAMTPEMVAKFCAAFSSEINNVLTFFKPDLIVCHHLYLVTALVVEANPSCPVTAVCHSTDLRQMQSHELERQRIGEGVRALATLFALHAEQKREIVAQYGVDPQRVHVVGTGYNSKVFQPVQGLREAGRLDVVYVGKIWRKKGVESLIRALDLLPYAAEKFTLRLVGGYNSADEYARVQARAAESRYPIEFLGKLPQAELANIYNQSHLFVLPSFFEGLPLVVVEALACGCQVVLTDLPGLREWLDVALPGAPLAYVTPPRFEGADEPVAADLPAFEARLAAALEHSAATAQLAGEDVSCISEGRLSWDALCQTLLRQCKE